MPGSNDYGPEDEDPSLIAAMTYRPWSTNKGQYYEVDVGGEFGFRLDSRDELGRCNTPRTQPFPSPSPQNTGDLILIASVRSEGLGQRSCDDGAGHVRAPGRCAGNWCCPPRPICSRGSVVRRCARSTRCYPGTDEHHSMMGSFLVQV